MARTQRRGGLARLFETWEQRSGILGLAFGPKRVAGKVASDAPHALTFFVDRKLPERGAKQRLINGAQILPRSVGVRGVRRHTDVVAFGVDHSRLAVRKQAGPALPAGGKVSNRSAAGTITCVLRRDGSAGTYLGTCRHVSLGTGNEVYVPSFAQGAVVCSVEAEVDLVPDERFLPVVDDPDTYADVDFGLARIPPPQVGRFGNDIPHIGRLAGIAEPDLTSIDGYRDSLVGLPAQSWSWNSGLRSGTVSHVRYVTRARPGGPVVCYSFLIESEGGMPAGLPRDSGKLWTTRDAEGRPLALGVHLGVVAGEDGARFAIATEFFSLANLLGLRLA